MVLDYGSGNLRSAVRAFERAGAEVELTSRRSAAEAADGLVVPGVGAFAACMNALSAIPGMVDALNQRVIGEGAPFLGVCVGMQLMADAGHEFGTTPGLGWIGGTVAKLEPNDPNARVPHMGWNDVTPVEPHPLIAPGEAYFLHSFGFRVADPKMLAATTQHGGTVTAAVARDNLIGAQFHPEKSQAYGLAFLSRFLDWRP